MTTAEILREARELVERGWCQGRASDEQFGHSARYCALGAVDHVTRYSSASEPAVKLLARALPEDGSSKSVPGFNDTPRRKKGEVLALFSRAIELAEAE